MDLQSADYKRLECSDNFPGPERPFFKLSKGVDLSFLFGAVRYRAIGSVSTMNVFSWRPYARVGSVKWICGFKFGHDKAGE